MSEPKRKAPQPDLKMSQALQMYAADYFIDGTGLFKWEEAYHGSDHKNYIADVTDPDWKLMVMVVRLRDKLHDDAKAAEKKLKADIAALSNADLAKRLRYHSEQSNELRAEAAERLAKL